ncbi:dipeptidase [Corynebacterium mendelii]|uniref:Dipeptidase n=1 Tax=Corynebacterium mendelii TaxID=2765362 RepID=A0A939E3V2_9CORY|nr:dipeptidase [Corynebacterium mendelii]MBN9645117.1 dipeptidase [Corynebacterium mendelii]
MTTTTDNDSTASCPATQAATGAIAAQADEIRTNLAALVGLNTVHGDPDHADDRAQAVDWLTRAITELGMGFDIQSFDTTDGSVAIVAKRKPTADLPTVVLYCHYDVVPVPDPTAWDTDPWTLTEKEGRWYGRGSADCKGNVVAHLAALKALKELGDTGLGLTLVIEGSEEKGGEGLDRLIEDRPDLVQADAIMIVDTGGVATGVPTLTTSLRGGALAEVTVKTLASPMHSGSFGGAAPDAVAALMRTLDSLRDKETGAITIDGVDCTGTWDGAPYDPETFRKDAGMLDGVEIMGGENDSPADQVWARPAVTCIGFDSTPVKDAVNAVPATATAKLNLRVPAGQDAHDVAEKLKAHLENHVPWGAHISVTLSDINQPFKADTTGPVMETLKKSISDAFGGKDTVYTGSGGSIPLTIKLQELVPGAVIALYGVEEPTCAIHSANESVDPEEIKRIAVAETLFLMRYARTFKQ